MRPSLLNPVFAPVTTLTGIGDKALKLLARLTGRDDVPRVIDLLFHLPVGVTDRRARPKLRDVIPGTVVTVAVRIDDHRPPPPHRPRAPFTVYASDETGTLTLTYFSARKDVIAKLLPVGSRRYISGTAEIYDGMLQMVHPDRVVDEAGLAAMALVEPVYPLTEGLTPNMLRRNIAAALKKLPAMPEWLDADQIARAAGPDFAGALNALHRPRTPGDAAPDGKAWLRLCYDELLANQLALALVRAHLRRPRARRTQQPPAGPHEAHSQAPGAFTALPSSRSLRERLMSALPFRLTPSQQAAIGDVNRDLGKPERMLRLLQGDVGSGKTVVALFACAAAIAAGGQAALMAPTELSGAPAPQDDRAAGGGRRHARRHSHRPRARARTRAIPWNGSRAARSISLIGTHALFSDDVVFRDLALAVIDEQHRFGVHQRLALASKGEAADLLVMTATPIPRSLVLAFFGDMDISELRDKPAGRKPSIPASLLSIGSTR